VRNKINDWLEIWKTDIVFWNSQIDPYSKDKCLELIFWKENNKINLNLDSLFISI